MAAEKETINTTILDHIDNIVVPGNVFCEPANEYWALVFLQSGMDFLYRQTLHLDQVVKQRVNPDDNIRCSLSGSLPEFHDIPMALLTCAFHWYAISACQYVRTVGAIANKLDASRPRADEYSKNIIPEVIAFRDKVAAHFAWSTKNNRDNDAERLASILPPFTFSTDSFYVGGMSVITKRSGKVSNSVAKPWSLCKIHEKLCKRYWPDQQNQ